MVMSIDPGRIDHAVASVNQRFIRLSGQRTYRLDNAFPDANIRPGVARRLTRQTSQNRVRIFNQ